MVVPVQEEGYPSQSSSMVIITPAAEWNYRPVTGLSSAGLHQRIYGNPLGHRVYISVVYWPAFVWSSLSVSCNGFKIWRQKTICMPYACAEHVQVLYRLYCNRGLPNIWSCGN